MSEPRRSILWSPDSFADLDTIWSYYASVAGRHTANTIIQDIYAAILLLEQHPFAGRSRDEVRPGLRAIVAGPHVVFYRVKREVVEIVRVLDGDAILTRFSMAETSKHRPDVLRGSSVE